MKKGDTQIWMNGSVSGKMNRKIEIFGSTEFRLANMKKLFFNYSQFNLRYNVNKNITIAPGYRQAYRRIDNDKQKWYTLYWPMIDIFLSETSSNWRFIDRNRIEYVMTSKPKTKARWGYRNMLTILTPWYFYTRHLTPYIADEVFFIQGSGLSQNRLFGGLQVFATRNLNSQIAYMWRLLKIKGKWRYNNVIWASVAFSF